MATPSTFVSDLTFLELLFLIILGWVLVALWQRCLDNFTYNSLELNKDSTYHTFIIAIVATIVFLVFIFTFNDILGDIVENDISGGIVPPDTTTSPMQKSILNSFENFNNNAKIVEEILEKDDNEDDE